MLSNGQIEIVISSGSGSPVEVRCPDCARLLFKADIPLNIISVSITTVCPRCRSNVRWPAVKQAESAPPTPNSSATLPA